MNKSNAIHPGYENETTSGPETRLDGITNACEDLAINLFNQACVLHDIADRVFGPRPPAPIEGQGAPPPVGALGQIAQQIDRCGAARQALSDAVDRFRALA